MKKVELSEAARMIVEEGGELTFGYTKDGNDYFFSDIFNDSQQGGSEAILMVVKNKAAELIYRLPCFIVSRNSGFSDAERKRIAIEVGKDVPNRAFVHSPGFMRKYGKYM